MTGTAKLIVSEGDRKGWEYPLLKFPFRIGRMADNDLVIEDRRVSRHHSEIISKDRDCIIQDLGSQNGTRVNGINVPGAVLKPGDTIVIGGMTLTFHAEREDIFSADEGADFETTVKSAKDILKDAIIEGGDESSVEILRDRASMLSGLYQLSMDFLRESEIEPILNRAADVIFRNIGADRVYVLLKDSQTGAISPLLSRDSRNTAAKGDRLMFSKTVINRVIDEAISLLVADARTDARFRESESIFLYGIRSAMCVPLLGSGRVSGTIYVDTLRGERQFTQEELNLLTTIGNLAAIVLEQVDLRERIRRESEARQSLMRYHSPQVVEEIIRGKGTCEVAERQITVLFSDIRDFTRLSDQLGPMDTAQLLNEYFDILTDTVFRHKGSIDKFIGDAAMVLFGAPFHESGYTEMAVQAAIEMQKQIRKLGRYEIRIGINTGPAVIGNIGSSKRIEYTAIGDTVNIASRIEKLALPGRIYIGESTYQQIKGIFRTREIGMQKVKGKTQEIGVYEVLY